MIAGISNSSGSVSTLPLSVRAESADSLLSNSAASAQAPDPAFEAADIAKTYRYNSFEFVYKQNFGKIVLLKQEPETGNEIAQFPSEYYLQQYAATARAQRNAELASSRTAEKATAAVSTEGSEPSGQSEPPAVTTPAAATIAASPSPAPSVAALVDIKV